MAIAFFRKMMVFVCYSYRLVSLQRLMGAAGDGRGWKMVEIDARWKSKLHGQCKG